MRNNPRDWRIEDLKVVANHFGIEQRQHGTSHVTFTTGEGLILTVPAKRLILPVYVRQFVALVDSMGKENEQGKHQ